MRLIDADELMTVTDVREDGTEVTYVPYSEIEDAPTAYDPDKVVEQLKKRAKGNCVRNSDSGGCPYIGNSEIDCEKCAMLRAIEIVKGGGVDG